jgi:hypothetical protein
MVFETVEPCILYKIKKPDVEAFLEDVYEHPELRTCLWMPFLKNFRLYEAFLFIYKRYTTAKVYQSCKNRKSLKEFPALYCFIFGNYNSTSQQDKE